MKKFGLLFLVLTACSSPQDQETAEQLVAQNVTSPGEWLQILSDPALAEEYHIDDALAHLPKIETQELERAPRPYNFNDLKPTLVQEEDLDALVRLVDSEELCFLPGTNPTCQTTQVVSVSKGLMARHFLTAFIKGMPADFEKPEIAPMTAQELKEWWKANYAG